MKNHGNKKLLIGIIVGCVLLVAISAIVVPRVTEYRDRLETIQSLQYEAIEADGIKYYPTTTPLMWAPFSLPPNGTQSVHKVIDGKTDYSHEYSAETFIDDYNKDYLYFDGIVFKKQ